VRYDYAVLPRVARLDVDQPCLVITEALQRLGDHLWAVVQTQHLRRATVGGEHLGEFGDQVFAGDRALHDVQQRFAGVFVDHRGDLDGLAVDSGVELEVDGPHHLRRISLDRRCRGDPGPLTWTADADLQALFAPQAVDLLLVDLTVFVVAQRRPGAP